MRVPHSFVPGTETEDLLGAMFTPCEVCCEPEDHVFHRKPENLRRLLGELFDHVVDEVSAGRFQMPPDGLLSRCSEVLGR